jgi:hypothetical protein
MTGLLGAQTPRGFPGARTPRGSAGAETPRGFPGARTPRGFPGAQTPRGLRGWAVRRFAGFAWPPNVASPGLLAVLAAVAVVHVVGIGWGLPASDGWDNDGVAPRDFLAGLIETFSLGKYYTYPPFHLLILALVTLPVTLAALARAPSAAPEHVIAEMLKPSYMTAIALLARLVTVAMSVGLAWSAAKIAEEMCPARPGERSHAGPLAAAACSVAMPLTYYAHTTNLDVPYLFWSALAMLALVRAVARVEPRRLRHAVVFAVLAVGTKDQAYGVFLLSAPLAIALWLAFDPRISSRRGEVGKQAAIAVAIGVALLLVVDGVVFNPTGFRARVAFLTGPASQDFAHYSNDWTGRMLAAKDALLLHFEQHYPLVMAPFAIGGIALVLGRGPRGLRVAGAIPLLAALSFTIVFNCAARRTEHRFLLPQMFSWGIYAGIAMDALVRRARGGRARPLAVAAAGGAIGAGLFSCLAVDANLLLDPRYDAEAWMREHVGPGDLVETYGLNVYLPRFPPQARVIRVGPEKSKNPMPGIEEVADRFGNAPARGARFLVVSRGWVWRYMFDPSAWDKTGRVVPRTQIVTATEPDGSAFFQGLGRPGSGYREAYVARWSSALWPALDVHASLSREILIFERER